MCPCMRGRCGPAIERKNATKLLPVIVYPLPRCQLDLTRLTLILGNKKCFHFGITIAMEGGVTIHSNSVRRGYQQGFATAAAVARLQVHTCPTYYPFETSNAPIPMKPIHTGWPYNSKLLQPIRNLSFNSQSAFDAFRFRRQPSQPTARPFIPHSLFSLLPPPPRFDQFNDR